MKPTLLILAAGIGSRYGGLKQIDGMGPQGETLMEYGIYDAIRAGFKKVVFLFRDDIVQAFEQRFKSIKDHIEVAYVFQEINPIVNRSGIELSYLPRTKPWGTAHAILSAAEAINEPFAVINADDFYGQHAYEIMSTFLNASTPLKPSYSVVGYPIEKTLSTYGQVSRATIESDLQGYLISLVERTQIERHLDGTRYYQGEKSIPIAKGTLVSTNFFGFTPVIFTALKSQFEEFVLNNPNNSQAEFFIPSVLDKLVTDGQARVQVLTCNDDWMGVTYKQDKAEVTDAINHLIRQEVYPPSLWS